MINTNLGDNCGSGSTLGSTSSLPSDPSLQAATCPNCGYCKHCGRSRNGQNFYPYQQPYTTFYRAGQQSYGSGQTHPNLTDTQNQQNLGNDALLRQSFQKS